MALHRDIFWVGRQWAVTGYGIQACDQKQKGGFDIEALGWEAARAGAMLPVPERLTFFSVVSFPSSEVLLEIPYRLSGRHRGPASGRL